MNSLAKTRCQEPILGSKFQKKYRFLSRSDYQSLKNSSKRLIGKNICIDYRLTQRSHPRIGITASKKFGTSCERNRFKRLIREAFRTTKHSLPPLDIHVIPRQYAKKANCQKISLEFLELLQTRG